MKRLIAMIAVLGAAGFTPHALAAGTAATTEVSNTANATFSVDGVDATIPSNEVTFRVDEIIDVLVVDDGVTTFASPDDADVVTAFTVTNTGNGVEEYILIVDRAGGGGEFIPENPSEIAPVVDEVYIDADGDGVFDPNVDTPFDPAVDRLTLDANDPNNTSVVVFVLSDVPPDAVSGETGFVDLTATSVTYDVGDPDDPNDDAPGTVYTNAGDDDENGVPVDAVVGAGNATSTDTADILVNDLVVTLVKSAEKIAGVAPLGTIDDGTGAGTAGVVEVPGDIIRYTLVLTVTGEGSVDELFITDAIPFDDAAGPAPFPTVVDYVDDTLTAGATTDDGTVVATRTVTDANDGDGGFQGTISPGFPNAGQPGVIVNVEQFLGLGAAATVDVTNAGSGLVFTVTFDVVIPDGSTP